MAGCRCTSGIIRTASAKSSRSMDHRLPSRLTLMLAPVSPLVSKPSFRSMVSVNPASSIGLTLTRSSLKHESGQTIASKCPMRACVLLDVVSPLPKMMSVGVPELVFSLCSLTVDCLKMMASAPVSNRAELAGIGAASTSALPAPQGDSSSLSSVNPLRASSSITSAARAEMLRFLSWGQVFFCL